MRFPETAVILSGGEGVRLRPITDDIPKGLVKVAGKPLLQWVVEWLGENGVSNLVIGVAYLKEKIMRYFGDGHRFGVGITYSVHTVEGGTGEGFRCAISRFVDVETFFALNGDQITDLRLGSLFRAHKGSNAFATIAVVHPRLPFGLVVTDEGGYCKGFVEKPVMKDTFCSSGIYVFQRTILDYLPERGDVEKTTFPRLASERRLKTYIHKGSFLTVNSLRELGEADKELSRAGK
ncbi:MAG TPA: nucleotidyltransferase family protein [Candidatus Bathyarchaeia archaeon]